MINENLGVNLSIAHLRNMLNTLVKKNFIRASKIDQIQEKKNRGKKPRSYYFEIDIIVKMVEKKQKKFINDMFNNKYGFALHEDDINRVLHKKLRPEILSLIHFKNANVKKFYKKKLTSEELQFLDKFGIKNTIQKLKQNRKKPRLSEQKIRIIVKSLIKKNVISEIILTQENIIKHELIDLLRNLKKNEKVYMKNTPEFILKSYLKEIVEKHLELIKILKEFIKLQELFEDPKEINEFETTNIFKSPINEVFQDIKNTFTSIELLEKEFEKNLIYKTLFERLKLGLLIFENGILKEFNETSQMTFKLNEYDIQKLSFNHLIDNENLIFLIQDGVKEILKENFIRRPILDNQWSGEAMIKDKTNKTSEIYKINIFQSIENNQIQIISELKS